MRLIWASALVAVICLISCSTGEKSTARTVKSASFDRHKYQKIAVASFKGFNKETGNAITDALIPDLMELGFTVVERKRLEAVLKEHALQQSGITEGRTTKQVGKLLNVDALLVGEYSAIEEPDQEDFDEYGFETNRLHESAVALLSDSNWQVMEPAPVEGEPHKLNLSEPQPSLLLNIGRGRRGGGYHYRAPRRSRSYSSGIRRSYRPRKTSRFRYGTRVRTYRSGSHARRFVPAVIAAEENHVRRFESISLRLVSIETGEVLLTTSRTESFLPEDLGIVLEDLVRSLKEEMT